MIQATHAVALLTILLLRVCSPYPTLNAMAPTREITVTSDVAYGHGPRHRLDIYEPRHSAGNAPVVVFLYGGAWRTGERGMNRFVGAALASRGLVAVIPDYSLYPAALFPTMMADAASAVAWVTWNAARFGGDPRRLFLMGHSAGAQMATLLALDPAYIVAAGLSDRAVCGVIGLAGPYDFHYFADQSVLSVMGPESDRPRYQPINRVAAQAPPMLLVTGQLDSTVDPANTLRLGRLLEGAGVAVRQVTYPAVGHLTLLAALSGPLAFLAPVRADTLRFIEQRGDCAGR